MVINGESSSWGNVISGVPQGSVLGLLLFFIYINNIDIDLFSKICKFADDTKIGHAVATEVEVKLLRDDFQNLPYIIAYKSTASISRPSKFSPQTEEKKQDPRISRPPFFRFNMEIYFVACNEASVRQFNQRSVSARSVL